MFTEPEEYMQQLQDRIEILENKLTQLRNVYNALQHAVKEQSKAQVEGSNPKNSQLSAQHRKRIREAMIATILKKRAELQEKLKKAIHSGIGYTIDELVQKLNKPKNTILRVLNEDPYFVKKNDHWYSIL